MKNKLNSHWNGFHGRHCSRVTSLLWLGLVMFMALPSIGQSPIDGFDPNVTGEVFAGVIQTDGKIIIGGGFIAVRGVPRAHIARLNVDGSLDNSFDPGANGWVLSVVVQRDGKILVGGWFTTLGGQTCNHIGRLNADGSVDASFNPGANDGVCSLALQPDGNILVGGYFTQLGGETRNSIARLRTADGSVDPTFNPDASGADFPVVWAITIQSDGRILVGGLFATLGGAPRNNIGRLNADGSLDTAFAPSANDRVAILAVQTDGKILVGGNFTALCGQTRNRIGRISSDGTLDISFNPTGANYGVVSLVLQPDGKILVGGFFTAFGGQTRNHVVRLDPGGGFDISFNPGASGPVHVLAVQPDGNIVVGGSFSSLGNQMRNNLGRLHPDGSLDTTLDPGATGSVLALALQADGKILAGGNFTTLAGQMRNYVGRLFPDGNLDTVFNPGANSSVLTLLVQADGKIVAGGAFTTLAGQSCNGVGRLLSNGSIDTSFNAGVDGIVWSLAVQPDGKILIGGDFSVVGGQTHPRIARLNPDGTPDGNFNPTANAPVRALALESDGKILMGGLFTALNGTTRNRIARLNPDGNLDANFDPGVTGTPIGLMGSPSVTCLAVQTDGKILVGGYFTSLAGAQRNYLGRLDANGVLDANFNPGRYFQVEGGINCLAVQTDHKILAGGRFFADGEDPEYFSFDRLVRIDEDGSFDKAFRTGGTDGGVLSLAVQTDGKVVAGGDFRFLHDTARSRIGRLTGGGSAAQSFGLLSFPVFPPPPPAGIIWTRRGCGPEVEQVTFELSTDNINYSQLRSATRTFGGWSAGVSLPMGQNFYVRARGRAPGGGMGSIVESVQQFYLSPSPSLRLGRLGPNAVYVAWPAWATNYELQSTINLGPNAVWTTVPLPPGRFGDEFAVPVIIPKPTEFFRLKLINQNNP